MALGSVISAVRSHPGKLGKRRGNRTSPLRHPALEFKFVIYLLGGSGYVGSAYKAVLQAQMGSLSAA